ncbi:MAG TPA: DUF6279 family lipoprotein [Solimonas sp.]
MRVRAWRALAAIAALLTLCGCSMTQLAYDNLDTLVHWELRDYVRLNDRQSAQFDAGFDAAWAWHRHSELPKYADDLRALAAALDAPLSRTDLEALRARLRAHQRQTMARIAELACDLGPSLDDRQVASLLAKFEADQADYARRAVDVPAARQRRDAERELLKQLRRWLGTVTPTQRTLISDWSAERPLVNGIWLDTRRQWRTTLADVLAARTEPTFCTRLSPLIVERDATLTQAQADALDANQARWLDLTEALQTTLTSSQRDTLRARLLELTRDLDALSASEHAGEPEPASAPEAETGTAPDAPAAPEAPPPPTAAAPHALGVIPQTIV